MIIGAVYGSQKLSAVRLRLHIIFERQDVIFDLSFGLLMEVENYRITCGRSVQRKHKINFSLATNSHKFETFRSSGEI